MLRITVHDEPESLTFLLEGKLAGTWVQELQECWQRTIANRTGAAVRFDLTEVSYIDAAGKLLLSQAHKQGVELFASGCLMRAIVAELSNARTPEKGNSKSQRGGL